ncbi:MAG: class I SAM-dependent methyltransferase [Candidatus Parvarchaeota archaeon]|nr:class I SAM-dependent methyltransferase [Candidatus Parvarchaeota archaeon]
MEDAVLYYDAIADSYESLYREEQIGKIKCMLKEIDLDGIETVLDIGAGTGILEEFLTGKDVTAIEPSRLSREILKKGLKNVKVINSRIEDVDITERFDLVVCLTTLQDLNEEAREICLDKAFKSAKRGGTVVVSVLETSGIDLSHLKPTLVKRAENDVIFFFRR